MKNKILLVLSCFVILTNCSVDDSNNDSFDDINYLTQWHLTNVTGGVAGIDDEFDLGVVIWTFKDENDTKSLSIVNENIDTTKEDFLDSGEYTYSEIEENSITYLVINNIEYGAITFPANSTTTNLVLNTNQLSNATGSDGFVYTFQRVLIQLTDEDQF